MGHRSTQIGPAESPLICVHLCPICGQQLFLVLASWRSSRFLNQVPTHGRPINFRDGLVEPRRTCCTEAIVMKFGHTDQNGSIAATPPATALALSNGVSELSQLALWMAASLAGMVTAVLAA